MMSTDSKSDASVAITAAIAEWFEATKSGVTPDREAFLNRFPMIRSEIAKVLDSFENVQSGIATSTHKKLAQPHLPPHDSPQPSMVTAFSVGETNTIVDSVSTNARYRELKQFNKGGLGNLFRAYDESRKTWVNETFRIKTDGSGRAPLKLPTEDTVQDASADGGWVVTASSRNAKIGWQLYVMHPDGTDQLQSVTVSFR